MKVNKKLIKFLITGTCAALIEYIIFIILNSINNNKNLYISQSISFIFGFIISFVLNKYWVYKSNGDKKLEIIKYTILATINLLLSNIAIIALSYTNLYPWISKIIVMIAIATWNYVIYQKIIFTKP